MSDPTQQEVLDSIDKGIRNAQEDYFKAFQSDIASPYAPEYLMTVYIFKAVLELLGGYGLALEVPVYDIEGCSHTKFYGKKPGAVRYDGKCDLVLFDSDGKSRAVIEVKKNAWAYYEDLTRLSCLLKLDLEFSVFATCLFTEVRSGDEIIAKASLLKDID